MASGAAAELRRIATAMRALPREIVEDGAKNVVVPSVNRVLSAHTGGDRSLSHAPGKLKVDVKIKGSGSSVAATITPGPKKGAARWGWLQGGTEPHAIGRGTHPGTEGKQTWTLGVTPALRQVLRDAGVKWERVVR